MKIAAVFIELKMNPGHLPVALEPRPSHEAVYHEFMCSEMVPDSARKMSGQPFSLGASPFPPLGMPFSMDPGPPCRVAPPPSGHHHTMPPLPPPPARPTLHVEVCQKQQSNMRASRLKEMVVELLREKRTTFGELVMTEFEDSVLKEHLQSVSITDTPNELKVRCDDTPMLDWYFTGITDLPPEALAMKLSISPLWPLGNETIPVS